VLRVAELIGGQLHTVVGRDKTVRGGVSVQHSPIPPRLPRRGVPVAFEVARAPGAPMDVIVVHKLGCPE
jgi:predicted phosphoribosyltransferase